MSTYEEPTGGTKFELPTVGSGGLEEGEATFRLDIPAGVDGTISDPRPLQGDNTGEKLQIAREEWNKFGSALFPLLLGKKLGTLGQVMISSGEPDLVAAESVAKRKFSKNRLPVQWATVGLPGQGKAYIQSQLAEKHIPDSLAERLRDNDHIMVLDKAGPVDYDVKGKSWHLPAYAAAHVIHSSIPEGHDDRMFSGELTDVGSVVPLHPTLHQWKKEVAEKIGKQFIAAVPGDGPMVHVSIADLIPSYLDIPSEWYGFKVGSGVAYAATDDVADALLTDMEPTSIMSEDRLKSTSVDVSGGSSMLQMGLTAYADICSRIFRDSGSVNPDTILRDLRNTMGDMGYSRITAGGAGIGTSFRSQNLYGVHTDIVRASSGTSATPNTTSGQGWTSPVNAPVTYSNPATFTNEWDANGVYTGVTRATPFNWAGPFISQTFPSPVVLTRVYMQVFGGTVNSVELGGHVSGNTWNRATLTPVTSSSLGPGMYEWTVTPGIAASTSWVISVTGAKKTGTGDFQVGLYETFSTSNFFPSNQRGYGIATRVSSGDRVVWTPQVQPYLPLMRGDDPSSILRATRNRTPGYDGDTILKLLDLSAEDVDAKLGTCSSIILVRLLLMLLSYQNLDMEDIGLAFQDLLAANPLQGVNTFNFRGNRWQGAGNGGIPSALGTGAAVPARAVSLSDYASLLVGQLSAAPGFDASLWGAPGDAGIAVVPVSTAIMDSSPSTLAAWILSYMGYPPWEAHYDCTLGNTPFVGRPHAQRVSVSGPSLSKGVLLVVCDRFDAGFHAFKVGFGQTLSQPISAVDNSPVVPAGGVASPSVDIGPGLRAVANTWGANRSQALSDISAAIGTWGRLIGTHSDEEVALRTAAAFGWYTPPRAHAWVGLVTGNRIYENVAAVGGNAFDQASLDGVTGLRQVGLPLYPHDHVNGYGHEAVNPHILLPPYLPTAMVLRSARMIMAPPETKAKLCTPGVRAGTLIRSMYYRYLAISSCIDMSLQETGLSYGALQPDNIGTYAQASYTSAQKGMEGIMNMALGKPIGVPFQQAHATLSNSIAHFFPTCRYWRVLARGPLEWLWKYTGELGELSCNGPKSLRHNGFTARFINVTEGAGNVATVVDRWDGYGRLGTGPADDLYFFATTMTVDSVSPVRYLTTESEQSEFTRPWYMPILSGSFSRNGIATRSQVTFSVVGNVGGVPMCNVPPLYDPVGMKSRCVGSVNGRALLAGGMLLPMNKPTDTGKADLGDGLTDAHSRVSVIDAMGHLFRG